MSTLREAAQLALEALEYGQHSLKQISEYQWESRGQLAMDALKAALAQPEPAQEPVACIRTWHKDGEQHAELRAWEDGIDGLPDGEHLLYTAPPEPAQEPVAVFDERMGQPVLLPGAPMLKDEQPLYTTPQPQRPPLTEEEIAAEWRAASECAGKSEGVVTGSQFIQIFARAIERKVRGE